MGNGSELLRMLEPAVRPVSIAPGAGANPGATPGARPGPIETRSFDSLLEEARQMNLMATPGASASDPLSPRGSPPGEGGPGVNSGVNPAPAAAAPLLPLAQFDRIENPSLRALIGSSADPAPMKLEN